MKIPAPVRNVFAAVCFAVTSVSAVQGGTTMVEFIKETEFSVAAPEKDAGAFAWSLDGTEIAVLASMMRVATVFTVPGGKAVGAISDLAGSNYSIAYAADGRVIVPTQSGSHGAATLWDRETGQTETVPGPDPTGGRRLTNTLDEFVLDPARTRLAGRHLMEQGAGTAFHIAVYDAKTWRLIADHAVGATGLAISPDGARIASIGSHGQINIINLQTGDMLLQFQANMNTVKHIAWSPDGQRLATGITGTDSFGLNLKSGKREHLHDNDVLQMWNAATGERIAAAQTDIGGGVESLEFSANGLWLVTTTSDGTCRLWNAATLELLQTVAEGLHPNTAMARFSPDSRRIAVIREGRARATIYLAR